MRQTFIIFTKMKLLIFYKTILLLFIAFAFPLMLIAGDKGIRDGTMNQVIAESDLPAFPDSIPMRRGESGQDKKSKDKNPQDISKGLKGNQRPSIKEVPRSMPKLKPQAVRDRIPIRKFPVKMPKKGFRINHFLI